MGQRAPIRRSRWVAADFLAGSRQPRSSGPAVRVRSREERDRPEPREGGSEADRPGPARRQVERETTGRSGEPASEAEHPTAERLRRDDPLTQADPGCPAGEVMGDDLDREPGPVGRELAGGQVIEVDPVLLGR